MSFRLRSGGSRVLVLATDAHGSFGGIAQYNRDVIEAMAGIAAVSEIVVVPRIAEALGPLPDKVRYDLSGTDGLRRYLMCCMRYALGGSGGRVDLVYCAHINLLPAARVIAAACRAPLVLAIYGIDAWNRPGAFVFRLLNPAAADLVISISRITLDRFEAWAGMARSGGVLLPNAIRVRDFGLGPADNALARRLKIEGRKVILTFGRMSADERYKGFDEVLEVMPRLLADVPRLVYVAAGDGSDRLRLQEKARDLGIAEHVVFTGRVLDEEKADLYRLADAYVMPSAGEGFGFVVLEALACGVPVVASSADGTREAVRDGELGLIIDPKDPAALAHAIYQTLHKPKLVPEGLGYFSFENFSRRLHEALDKIMPFHQIQ